MWEVGRCIVLRPNAAQSNDIYSSDVVRGSARRSRKHLHTASPAVPDKEPEAQTTAEAGLPQELAGEHALNLCKRDMRSHAYFLCQVMGGD
jgi:hypothetical protein